MPDGVKNKEELALEAYSKKLIKGNGRLGKDGSAIMYTSPKGNILTQKEWQDNQSSKAAYPSPEFLMNKFDGYAVPEPLDVAEVAARSFLKTPNAVNNNYKITQGISMGLNGSRNTYPITPAQNRAADSAQFVNQYYASNELKAPVITPEQRLIILKRLQKK